MPDVRVTNPEVKVNLSGKESTTVPSGERWIVDLTRQGSNPVELFNSSNQKVLSSSANRLTRVRLSGGDLVNSPSNTRVSVRGEVIST